MASRGQMPTLSASASAAVAQAKALSTSAAAVMESLFQKSLQDLVKGLRAQTIGEALFLAQILKDVRKEMKSKDALTKSIAVQKLTYLHMLQSSDMSWAAFPIIEVMSSPKFAWKQIGYLAACQSFRDDTEVLLLTTNLVRKDLGSSNQVEVALALNYISTVSNADLAGDLTPDVFAMLNSGRPLVRKRATLVLLRLVEKYPDGLQTAFRRLVERLDDNETGVVAAAVNVLCQLAAQDPPKFLPLAPDFFRLLTSSTNTWLRIKVVKLFGLLAPLEPRLAKKLSDPLCEILRSTPAKSLQFEIIKTVTGGMPQQTTAVAYCILRLGEFIQEGDPNLCYLALKSLASLLPHHSKALGDLKAPLVACLGNPDPGIQNFALKILTGLVIKTSLVSTVRVLQHLWVGAAVGFRDGLVQAVLEMGGGEVYEKVEDFEWYSEVVFECAVVPGITQGGEVARQIVDLAVRVGGVRSKLVLHSQSMVLHSTRLGGTDSETHPTLARALSAAAWVLGEFYPSKLQGEIPVALNPRDVIGGLVQKAVQALPPAVQATYLQALMKILLTAINDILENREMKGESLGVSVVDGKGEEDEGSADTSDAVRDTSGMGGVVNGGISLKEGGEGACLEGGDGGGRAGAGAGVGEREADEGALDTEGVEELLNLVRENISELTRSCHVEVQERGCEVMALVEFLSGCPKQSLGPVVSKLKNVFSEELLPVALGAQKRVPLPASLILPENLDGLREAVDSLPPQDTSWSGYTGLVNRVALLGEGAWGDPLTFNRTEETDGGGSRAESHTNSEGHRAKNNPFYLPMDDAPTGAGFVGDVIAEGEVLDPKDIFEDRGDRKSTGVSRMEVRRQEEDLPPLPGEAREVEVEGGVVIVKRHRRKKEGASGSKKPHRRKEGRGDGGGQKDGEARKAQGDVKKVALVGATSTSPPLFV